MIVAFTDYEQDEVTTILAAYARTLLNAAGSLISQTLAPPTDSYSVNIQAVLASGHVPFFFFGHGDPDPPALLGQDKTTALDASNSGLLRNRFVCAICCYSIAALYEAVSNHNATVLGYDGELAVILCEPYSSKMEDCVLAGPRALLFQGCTAGEACQEIQARFYAMARELITGSIEDQVVAVFMELNAGLIKLLGDSKIRIK
ncbi:MAG TPA: hypothetical protein VJ023_08990 [Pyrinomonadaceae bacterium]|nr:hypothetical protein [Pyrinomonadaceae bacterium]